MRAAAVAAAYLALAACSTRDDGANPSAPPSAPGAERATAPVEPVPATDAASAAPFAIEYRLITKAPTCRGNRRIRVDERGGVFEAVNDGDCPPGTPWQKAYPAAPGTQLAEHERSHLRGLIESSGVLALPAVSTDPAKVTTGGYREELEIDLDGRRTVVAVENAKVPAFAQVKQALVDLAAR